MTHSQIALVGKAQQGDEQAWSQLVSKWRPWVFTITNEILKHTQDAEDATQDVFMEVLKNLNGLRDLAAFAGWLRSIAENTAKNRFNQRKRRSAGELFDTAQSECEPPLEGLIHRQTAVDLLEAVEKRFPTRDKPRKAAEAIFSTGDMDEAATSCGESRNWVDVNWKRFKELVAQLMIERGMPLDDSNWGEMVRVLRFFIAANGLNATVNAACACIWRCNNSKGKLRRQAIYMRIAVAVMLQQNGHIQQAKGFVSEFFNSDVVKYDVRKLLSLPMHDLLVSLWIRLNQPVFGTQASGNYLAAVLEEHTKPEIRNRFCYRQDLSAIAGGQLTRGTPGADELVDGAGNRLVSQANCNLTYASYQSCRTEHESAVNFTGTYLELQETIDDKPEIPTFAPGLLASLFLASFVRLRSGAPRHEEQQALIKLVNDLDNYRARQNITWDADGLRDQAWLRRECQQFFRDDRRITTSESQAEDGNLKKLAKNFRQIVRW